MNRDWMNRNWNGFNFERGSSSATASKHCPVALRAALLALLLVGAGLMLAAQAQTTQPTPYTGTPISVPGSFEAENFDRGGEGVAYHDNSTGNSGGKYRLSENVDIVVSRDALGGGYVVNDFETGEWLAFTIDVTASSQYDIELRVSSNFSNSAFHIEIDGVNVTGTVPVPNTGNWRKFQWVGKKGVPLAAGKHVLKVAADRQYFNLNSLRLTQVADTQAPSVPANLTATGVSASQVDLSWSAATDNVGVTGYRVYRAGILLATLGAVTNYQDTGLTASTSYSYTVQAIDAAGNASAQSAPASVTTPAATAALAISSFQPTSDATNGYYRLTYTGTPSRIQVFLDTDKNTGTGYPTNGIGANYLVEIGAGYGNLFSYSGTGGAWGWTFVKAVTFTNANGVANITIARTDIGSPSGVDLIGAIADSSTAVYTVKMSQVLSGGPDTTAPSVPTGLVGTAVSSSQVNLSWNPSTDSVGVTGYVVYLNNVSLATTTTTSFQHTGLTAGTTYNYRVSAYDAVPNHSAWTATPVAVTTPAAAADTQAPSVPTGLVGKALSSSQIDLSWNPSTDNVGVAGYYIYLNDVALTTTTATSFQHTGLTAGTTYSYRVSAYDAVPNHSAWSATPVAVTTTPLPGGDSAPDFFCTFSTSPTDCGFQVQEKVPGRATIVNVARDGSTGLRLHTEPGDNNVAGSGEMERNDLWLTQAASDGYEGREAWWALSVRFPDDFVFPKWHRYALAGFHHTGSTGQGNFTLGFERGVNDSDPGILGFQGYGGVQNQLWAEGKIQLPGIPLRNVWYDFVYHIRWSSGPDGFFDAWVNGVQKLSHRGPTLYEGQGVYLKLANYHNPLCDPYPACIGVTNPPSSVIYDRVVRGPTALSVSSGPLEGVLTLVNGVLTPLQ